MQMMIGFIRASAFLLFIVASIASIESTDGFSTSASQSSTSNLQSTTPSTTSTALHVNTFRSTKPSTPSVIVSKGPVLIHDFILSDNYCIFNLNKCELERSIVLKALLGLTGFAGVIDIDQDATETSIVMIPRSLFDETEGVTDIDFLEDDRIIVVPVQNHFNFHFGNCFEDENGNVCRDFSRWHDQYEAANMGVAPTL